MSESTEFTLPYFVDPEAQVQGYFVVFDHNFKLVQEFKSIEEAEAFVATANGEDLATVRQNDKERAQAFGQYRDNVKRGSRTKP